MPAAGRKRIRCTPTRTTARGRVMSTSIPSSRTRSARSGGARSIRGARVRGERRERLLAARDAGAFVPRLRKPDRDEEVGACRNCDLRPACLRGDSGARMRLAAWADAAPADPSRARGARDLAPARGRHVSDALLGKPTRRRCRSRQLAQTEFVRPFAIEAAPAPARPRSWWRACSVVASGRAGRACADTPQSAHRPSVRRDHVSSASTSTNGAESSRLDRLSAASAPGRVAIRLARDGVGTQLRRNALGRLAWHRDAHPALAALACGCPPRSSAGLNASSTDDAQARAGDAATAGRVRCRRAPARPRQATRARAPQDRGLAGAGARLDRDRPHELGLRELSAAAIGGASVF